MSGPSYHGWTHRPKGQGGTDPVPPFTTWAKCTRNTAQTVTTTTELEFINFRTNDTATFGWDETGDPSGLLIRDEGLYMVLADVIYNAGDIGVERSIYSHWDALSAGVTFGNELRPAIGTGQTSSGIAEVDNAAILISKGNLSHYAIAELFNSTLATDPFRAGIALVHTGVNYTIKSGSESTLTVVRLSTRRSFFDGTP